MARVHYGPIPAREFTDLDQAVATIMRWQTKVKPFGPEYDLILKIKADLNALAELSGAQLPFPPAR